MNWSMTDVNIKPVCVGKFKCVETRLCCTMKQTALNNKVCTGYLYFKLSWTTKEMQEMEGHCEHGGNGRHGDDDDDYGNDDDEDDDEDDKSDRGYKT